MSDFICKTCGTQYAEGEQPPPVCAVCQDDRQYLKVTGQQWIKLDKLRLTHRDSIRFEEPAQTGIGVEPHFATQQKRSVHRRRRNSRNLADNVDYNGEWQAAQSVAHRPRRLALRVQSDTRRRA